MALEDSQKYIAKKYKKHEIVLFFLAISKVFSINPTNFIRPRLNGQFFLSFNFYFGHTTPCGLKTWKN